MNYKAHEHVNSFREFPYTAWKASSVVPIPKGNNHTCVSNYRPISSLPILSKLLERHIYGLIFNHLNLYPLHCPTTMGLSAKEIFSSYLFLLMLYTNGQKLSTKVVKYVLSSSTYGRHLTRFLINHLLTNLEHLTLTPTYLGGYMLLLNNSVDSAVIEGNCISYLYMLMTCYY